MEVVTKFRCGSPEDIRQEVKHSMNLCRDKAALVFFTSNTITPDIPLENIRTYWDTVRESAW
jgi:uroporphyrinogen-III decarboxylase